MSKTEMKVGWTKGPWFEGTGWIGHGDVKEGRAICRIDGYPYGNSEANARLISKAPEMAELLQEFSDVCREMEPYSPGAPYISAFTNRINRLLAEIGGAQ